MRSIVLTLLMIFQFSTHCFAETGPNERPINLPVLENLRIINDKHANEIRAFQAKMPNSEVLAIYLPTNPALGLPLTVISKINDIPVMTEAEWLSSRPAIVEDFKLNAAEKTKHPTAHEINSTSALSGTVSHLKSTLTPGATLQELTPIKIILDRNEAITFLNTLKYKENDKAPTSAVVNAITMIFINGNLFLITTNRPYTNDADYDLANKYNDNLISKFLAANPKTVFTSPALALDKTLPLASASPAEKAVPTSHSYSLHDFRPILIFFPMVILLVIIQYFINRKAITSSAKISFGHLMFSWKGTLTGFQSFLGSVSALIFYTTLFFIPIVFLAMTNIELFSQHREFFHGIFLLILIGLIYSLIGMLVKFRHGK